MNEPLADEDEMGLKLVHTADWHLGTTFPGFSREDRLTLSRARLEVVDRILGLAERHEVHAVVCAGDLFDDAEPDPQWWRGLAEKLSARHWKDRPVILLPGNHDPLTLASVYSSRHPFRELLPSWVHVVDRDDFELEIGQEAVVYAVPCRSRSESRDLSSLFLPKRARGDRRVRIGLVHGQTFDIEGCQMNFPIAPGVAEDKGLDYLAIGDTHGFRDVTPRSSAPTVYPGAPEATNFGEVDPGHAALVYFPKDRTRRALVRKERVGQWKWRSEVICSAAELDRLCAEDLTRTVLRVELRFAATAGEIQQVEQRVAQLRGGEAQHGLAGVLQLDQSGLSLDARDIEESFEQAPAVLRAAARRLRALGAEPGASEAEAEVARRALYQLYRLTHEAR